MTIAVLGEALVDLILAPDGSFRPHLGGSPFNVAIGLARQGLHASYLSPFSDDAFGQQLISALVRENVAMPTTRRSAWPTSLALVTLEEDGQPSYRLYREGIADKDISAQEIIDKLPDDLSLFHTGSLAITPSQLPKLRTVFGELQRRGVPISLDINIRLKGSMDREKYLQGVRDLLPAASLVKASDEDIDAFSLGFNARGSAEILYKEMNGGMLALTEGGSGVCLFSPQGLVEVPGFKVVNVADTVGAGDTFHSALLAALCRSAPEVSVPALQALSTASLESSLYFACAAAAINVSRQGCSPPTYDEVEAFLLAQRRS
ncbi:carbohydrate kinase [Congregibacter variabilis]|uniref:Carbohydrate kinase n=1 Tax=Congregibacter variabilis TaxID=3081200 RepID=A0ABZ0I1Q7_9GAMM|nr:carbohydrate kinase [Congregibacter sp. IMCC43200]